MRDRTSCASRSSVPSGLTPLAESCAAGRAVAAGLLLTVTAALPLPIAPPGFPIALGLSFFFFPGLVNALAPNDFWSSDRTDLAATGPGWGVGTCSRAGVATVGIGGICALGAGEVDFAVPSDGEAGVGEAGIGGAGTCEAAGPGAPLTWSPTVVVGTEPAGDWAGRRGGSKTLPLGLFTPDDPEAVVICSGDRAGDPAPRGIRSAAGVAGMLVLAVGAAGVAGVAGGAAEPAAGDFQPTLVVAAEDGPEPRAAPLDAGGADEDVGPADGDAAGDGAPVGDPSGEGGGLAWCVTSRLVTPVLANPGLAKPAAVSPRASAAAASVSAAPSCEPPSFEAPPCEPSVGGPGRGDEAPGKPVLASVGPTASVPGVLAPAGLAVPADAAGPAWIGALPDLAEPSAGRVSGLGTPRGVVIPAGVNTLSGLADPSGLPFPSGPGSPGRASPRGIVTSERLASADFEVDAGSELRSDGGVGALENSEGEFLVGSFLRLPDFRTVVSSFGAAPPASSATCSAGSCLSTHPPVKSLASTLSATSHAGTLIARSPQS